LLRRALKDYSNTNLFVWCQDEPKNQGAWFASQHHLCAALPENIELRYAGRPFSAAPAVGYPAKHVEQQHKLVDDALGIKTEH
jgi:2-oxoglutarate dehydrogenase E1 component